MYRRTSVLCGLFSGLVLCASLALGAINGSPSTNTSSVDFPRCNGTASWFGDGECDFDNNNMECGYDGGDCCECTCVSTISLTCGTNGFSCLDPEAGKPILGCELVETEPPAVSPCVTGASHPRVVRTTAEADLLATSILCSGGRFEVEWKGYVSTNRTLYVIDGTVLNVVGSSDAVADGGGLTQLFFVSNGTLRINDLEMSNGASTHGGAIFASRNSRMTLSRANFSHNTADYFGGAVYLDSSKLELANGSTFIGNSAIYGGAIHMTSFSVSVPHVGNGEIHLFIGNNATDGGALYVSGASVFSGVPPNDLAITSTYATPSPGNNYFTFGAGYGQTRFFNNTAEGSGGAVYIDDLSNYYWLGQTTFEGNSADYGGALFLGDLLSVQLQGVTRFAHNSARKDGGAVASAINKQYHFVFFNGSVSFLNNNCGGSGGALALYGDMDLRWGDTAPQFSGNGAALFGGAIYVSEATSGHQFIRARFTENEAQSGGAVLAAGCGTAQDTLVLGESIFYPTTFSNCTFDGNSAQEAGGAIEISVGRVHVSNTEFDGNSARNGGAVRLFGTAELFNSSFSDNESVEGGGSAISNFGIISELTGLRFSANRFLCAASDYVDFNEGSPRLAVACQGCDTPCQGCTVEDSTLVPTCMAMFEHAHSKAGTATIEEVVVDSGYWRASNKSLKVYSCQNPEACLGGLTDDQGFCDDGYEGPYCSVCSEGYAATLAFRCRRCSGGNMAMVVLVLVIAVIGALAFMWHMVSIETENATQGVVARVEKVLPLQSIKIVVVAWQIVTQFSSAAHVIYPETYQRLLDVLALVNFDMGWVLSAGCVMDLDFHEGLLMATVGPMVIIALLGITYRVAIIRNQASKVALSAVRRKHLGAIVLVSFFVYSSVSSTIFRTFACEKLDDGNLYLRTDYRIECNSSRHKAFQIYAGLMILVYPVGIPLFYTILLFREHGMLMQGFDRDTPRYDSTSSLRKPYRASVFYYEVVECSRRILLTGVAVFIYPDTSAQIAVTIMIAFAFVLLSEGLSPYASRWDSWVSRTGHVIVFLSMYVALLLKVDVSNENSRDQSIFAGILVAAHAVMILVVIVETMALLYSMRNHERLQPVPRRSITQSGRVWDRSSSVTDGRHPKRQPSFYSVS